MIGEINQNSQASSYQPSSDIVEFTHLVQQDYQTGMGILNRPWTELNDRSIIDDENRGQMMFNAFVDESVEDPGEAWKWRGTRSLARNKGVAMHANLTAGFLLPLFVAQNENDETDRDFSEAMRDIIEWMTSPSVSNYEASFLQMVFGMITNPITYIGTEYCEVFQTIREKQADGSYTTKEILDEVLSGFQAPIWSSSQVLIINAYERNMQRQRRIIKRRLVEKTELEAKYGDHANWDFVTIGQKSIYNTDDGLFYDIADEETVNTGLVWEETALSRREDSEVCFINGIYMGSDNIEDNPIYHRDNRNAPKYNIVPFGYHRIGEHFFAYKSMMNAVGWDNMLYDAMSEVVMNRAILETEMPIAVTGSEKIDSDMIFPNAVISFENENARATPLLPNSNMAAAFNALRETEDSINKGTINETSSGQLPDAAQKAYNVAQAQAAAKKLIGAVGRSLAESVVYMGDLMKDIVLNHITIPQVDELTTGALQMKYRSFLLENKTSAGKMTNKYIKFDESLIGTEMTPEERTYANVKLYEETEKSGNRSSMLRINPRLFAKFKYLTKADPEEIFSKNQEYWQPVLLNLKTALLNDPYTNQEFLTRKIGYAYFQSGGDDMVKKPMPQAISDPMNPGGANPLGNQVNQKQLSTVSAGAVT
jgi:hypothetical protein